MEMLFLRPTMLVNCLVEPPWELNLDRGTQDYSPHNEPSLLEFVVKIAAAKRQ